MLPFANIGGGAEQEYFVDGVTESLTTDLSRIRGSFVIGRNTAFTYKGKAVDLKQIGRELNVRYVLEGSVQRGGNRMRVNVQLIDAETGNHLWAERFDKPLADLFDMQDEIVARLADALNAQLVAAEARRAEQAPNPDSMDLYFQGLAWVNKGLTPDNIAQARSFFDRALSADPDNVDALVGSARADAIAGDALCERSRGGLRRGRSEVDQSLVLGPGPCARPFGLGSVYILPSAPRRASPNANMRWRWIEISPTPMPVSDWVRFISAAPKKPRLTLSRPCASVRATRWLSRWMHMAGFAKNHLGLWEQAVAWFRRAIEANRNHPHTHFQLAAALARLGRLDEARSAVKAGLALNPAFTISRYRAAWTAMNDDPTYLAQLERLLEAMRKAGVPES